MQAEIEVKFTDIDKEDIRTKLRDKNALLEHAERMMRRKTFDFLGLELQPGEYKWMRVRDEGHRITMNIKHLTDKHAVDGVKELEITVENFDDACSLLLEMGLVETNSQENYRESWRLGKCEVTIDTWPGLKPFVEIEGPTEDTVRSAANSLDFDFSKAVMGSVDFVYEHELGIPENDLTKVASLTFSGWETELAEYL